MATATSRMNLRKPDDGDIVDVVLDINNNLDIIDNALGPVGMYRFPADTPYPANTSFWSSIVFGTTADIVIKAKSGDWIEVGISAFVAGGSGNQCFLDVASIVAGAPVSWWGGTGIGSPNIDQGIQAWRGQNLSFHNIGGGVARQIGAGDIEAGNIRLRIHGRQSAAAPQRSLWSSAGTFSQWHAINRGQM